MSVCTHVPLTYSSVLGEKNNKTMRTHTTEITGIESTVVIYEWIFSFGPVLGIEYTQQTILPLSHTTPVPNSVSITVY